MQDSAENTEELNVVDESDDDDDLDNDDTNTHPQQTRLENEDEGDPHEMSAREKYKKSILHRYLADSVEIVNALKNDCVDATSNGSQSLTTNLMGKESVTSENNGDETKDLVTVLARKRKTSSVPEEPKEKSCKKQEFCSTPLNMSIPTSYPSTAINSNDKTMIKAQKSLENSTSRTQSKRNMKPEPSSSFPLNQQR